MMVEYTFRRYVNGKEMAEGVRITIAASLDEAMRKAVAMCPERGTVLVLENAFEAGRAEAFEEAAKCAERNASYEATYDYEQQVADRIARAIRALAKKPPK